VILSKNLSTKILFIGFSVISIYFAGLAVLFIIYPGINPVESFVFSIFCAFGSYLSGSTAVFIRGKL